MTTSKNNSSNPSKRSIGQTMELFRTVLKLDIGEISIETGLEKNLLRAYEEGSVEIPTQDLLVVFDFLEKKMIDLFNEKISLPEEQILKFTRPNLETLRHESEALDPSLTQNLTQLFARKPRP